MSALWEAASALPALTVVAGWRVDRARLRRRLDAAVALGRCPITGLPTRRPWTTAAEALLRRPGRVFVVLVDLDRFKAVNDGHGHHVGDVVLQVQAARLRDWCHQRGVAGRLGGDEFAAVVHVDGEHADGELAALAELTRWLQLPVPLAGGPDLQVGASVGVVAVDDLHGPSLSVALHAADLAMYEAKRAGGATIRRHPGGQVHVSPAPLFRVRHHGPAGEV